MKLSKILAILMAVLISPVISFASEDSPSSEREYVKLIEEGKTWEYIYLYYSLGRCNLTAFQMRFDGTETRNGVEYNKLVYCGNLTTWKADGRNDNDQYKFWWEDTPREITTRPSDITAYFLMREESGKIYLYVKDLIEGKNNSQDYSWIEGEIPALGDETLIYDFTKNPEEILENVLCAENAYVPEIYPLVPAAWFSRNLIVNNVSMVNLNGIDLKLQELRYYYDDSSFDDRYSCLEGVGNIKTGFLPFIDYTSYRSNGIAGIYYLNRLTHANGETIYQANEDYYRHYIDVAKIIDMAEVEQPVIGPSIARSNDEIKAEDAVITLFDLSGRMVVSGYESVSTISLQPGVYIAKAESPCGISTLKIRID